MKVGWKELQPGDLIVAIYNMYGPNRGRFTKFGHCGYFIVSVKRSEIRTEDVYIDTSTVTVQVIGKNDIEFIEVGYGTLRPMKIQDYVVLRLE